MNRQMKNGSRKVQAFYSKNTGKNGFTLLELLIVIAIIAILAGLLLPALNAARQKGVAAACIGNLKQIGMGELNYAMDYKEQFHGWVMNNVYIKELNAASDNGWSVFLWVNKYLPRPGNPKSIFHCAGQPHLQNNEYSVGTDANCIFYKNNNYSCNANFMPTFAGSKPTAAATVRISSIKTPGGKLLFTDGLQRLNGATITEGIVSQSFDSNKFALASQWGRFTYPHANGINAAFVDGHAAWIPRAQVINHNEISQINTIL